METKLSRLTEEHYKETTKKVFYYINKFNELYKFNMPSPNIFYDIKGTKAGVARMSAQGAFSLHFNPKLAALDWNEFINNTVAHEVSHLAVFHWCRVNNKKISQPHGPQWSLMMRQVGATPRIRHDLDVKDIKRKVSQYEYKCKCEKPILLSVRTHNNIKNKIKSYKCKKCGTILSNGTKHITTGFLEPSPNGTTKVRES